MGREEPPRHPRQLPQREGCHGHNGPVETSNHKSLIEVIGIPSGISDSNGIGAHRPPFARLLGDRLIACGHVIRNDT